MAGPATLKIEIIADAAKAVGVFGRVETAAGKAGSGVEKSGSKFGSFAKSAARVVSGAALGGLVAMFKTGVGEQKDFLSGQAQLANGIKSTGNAANVSVKGLEDLASSVQNYSGQTDDSIVASEKLLLTFTNVGNKAGKNNDIFNQATKMTADMAAKMGGDASKYAVQLGKALNDPTKGIAGLTRVGVTFTAAQKKSIKTMQDSGNTLGAQKVIMGELKKEFGGSAKAAGQTLPGQMKRAQRSFEDVSQNLVASFMPVISQVADILIKDVLPAFKSVMGYLSEHQGVFLAIAGGLAAIAGGAKVIGIIKGIGSAIKGISGAFSFLAANPIVLIIVAIVALGVAMVVLYKKSATFRAIVQGAFKGIVSAGKAVGRFFTQTLPKVFRGFVDFLKKWGPLVLAVLVPFIGIPLLIWQHFSKIKGFVSRAFTAALAAIGHVLAGVWSVITGAFKGTWTWIYNNVVLRIARGFSRIVAAIAAALAGVFKAITGAFRGVWTWVYNNVVLRIARGFGGIAAAIGRGLSGIFRGITGAFKGVWTWVYNNVVLRIARGFGGIAGGIAHGLGNVASTIAAPFKSAWTWIKDHIVTPMKNMFTGLAHAITSAMSGVFDAIIGPFKSAWDWISRHVLSPIKSAWNGVANAINSIHISVKVPKGIPVIGGKGFTFDPPNVPTLAAGGYVDQATLAIIGEGRGGEIVAPDDMLRRIIREEMAGRPGITINGALDPVAVAKQLRSILKADERRRHGVTVGAA